MPNWMDMIDQLKKTYQTPIRSLAEQRQLQRRITEEMTPPAETQTLNSLKQPFFKDYLTTDEQTRSSRQKLREHLCSKLSYLAAQPVGKQPVPDLLQDLQHAIRFDLVGKINAKEAAAEIDSILAEDDLTELSSSQAKRAQKQKALTRGDLIASLCDAFQDTTPSELLGWDDKQIEKNIAKLNYIYQLGNVLNQTLDNQNPIVQFSDETRSRCENVRSLFEAASLVNQRVNLMLSPYYPYLDTDSLLRNTDIDRLRRSCQPLGALGRDLLDSASAERRIALLQLQQTAQENGFDLDKAGFTTPAGKKLDLRADNNAAIEYIYSGNPVLVTQNGVQIQFTCHGRNSCTTEEPVGYRSAFSKLDTELEELTHEVDNADPLYLLGKEQFRNMKHTLQRFSQCAKVLKTQNTPCTVQQLREFCELSQALVDTSQIYLNYKTAPSKDSEHRRVAAARAVHEYAISALSSFQLATNELRAVRLDENVREWHKSRMTSLQSSEAVRTVPGLQSSVDQLDAGFTRLLSSFSGQMYSAFDPTGKDADKPLTGNALNTAKQLLKYTVLQQILTADSRNPSIISQMTARFQPVYVMNFISMGDNFQKELKAMTPRKMHSYLSTLSMPSGPMTKLSGQVFKDVRAIYGAAPSKQTVQTKKTPAVRITPKTEKAATTRTASFS